MTICTLSTFRWIQFHCYDKEDKKKTYLLALQNNTILTTKNNEEKSPRKITSSLRVSYEEKKLT